MTQVDEKARKHIATCGTTGWAGHRVGTRYFYDFEEARGAQNLPWFRWRNDEIWRAFLAWSAALTQQEKTHDRG